MRKLKIKKLNPAAAHIIYCATAMLTSLALTGVVVFAWFAHNENISSGIGASISSGNIYDLEVSYYNLTNKSGTEDAPEYLVGEMYDKEDEEGNALDIAIEGYGSASATLIAVSYKVSSSSSTSIKFEGLGELSFPADEVEIETTGEMGYKSYLSNGVSLRRAAVSGQLSSGASCTGEGSVICFADSAVFTSTDVSTKQDIVYDEDGASEVTEYIILEYDEENVAALYSGRANLATPLGFTKDIRLSVDENTSHVHSYSKWDITSLPTNISSGLAERSCLTCADTGSVQQVSLPIVEEGVTDFTDESGVEYYSYYCEEYGATFSFVIAGVNSECEENGHTWDEGEYVAPTCTSEGGIKHTCYVCGAITWENEEPALGHTPQGEGTIIQESTCLDEGIIEYTCSRCGETYRETIPKSHNYVAYSVVEPDCENMGYTIYKCSICGNETYDDFTPALGHSFDEGVLNDDGTLITYTCTRCGYTYSEEPKTTCETHSFEVEGSDADDYDMSQNGWTYELVSGYSYTIHAIITCSVCGTKVSVDMTINGWDDGAGTIYFDPYTVTFECDGKEYSFSGVKFSITY